MVQLNAPPRIRLSRCTVDHGVEHWIPVRRGIVSARLDLAARPFLSHRRWRWLDVPRVEQRVEVALLHPGAEGVDLHRVDGNSRTGFSPLILKQHRQLHAVCAGAGYDQGKGERRRSTTAHAVSSTAPAERIECA